MVKTDLPYAYEAIAEQIGIDIDNYTIYDDFCDYFKEVKRFGVQEMLSLFRGIFFVPYVSDLYHKERENTENRERLGLEQLDFIEDSGLEEKLWYRAW